MAFLFLIAGLALILLGANLLTDGAAALAKRFAIPDLVIGLTVVAFGTSAPELAVSLLSAINGSAGMAIGNVVGSNIFNTLLIVGCTAVIVPLRIGRSTLTKEIPFCLLASLLLWACVADRWLDGASAGMISRTDGLMLLGFFVLFFSYTRSIAGESEADEAADNDAPIKSLPLWRSLLMVAAGLGGLIFGGQLFVDGAAQIARSLGVSEAIVGLTVVAGGTSLPELATSVVAALKKNSGIAIGNVIGSNLFNIFLILGITAVVRPLDASTIQPLDFAVMTASCLLLLVFGRFFGRQVINRPKGFILLALFAAYMTWLVASI